MTENLDENLLAAWLRLSAGVRNERLVKGMSFNEISVCNILNAYEGRGVVSATDIVEKTGMLKSQVNKVLSDLEAKGFIERRASKTDKRKIEVMLTKEGSEAYTKEHEDVMVIMKNLRNVLGEDEIKNATATLNKIAEAMREIEA